MKLRIQLVHSTGRLGTEQIGLVAEEPCDASNYMLSTCSIHGRYIGFSQPSLFRLPQITMNPGDWLCVWSKSHALVANALSDGNFEYHVGWKRRRPIWSAPDVAVVLLEIAAYDAFAPATLQQPARLLEFEDTQR
jgi:hypothetical protein